MQKIKTILLLVFFAFILIEAHSFSVNNLQERDTNVVRLNFGANEYKELMLTIRNGPDSIFHFPGSLKDDVWTIEYPRRLYEKCRSFRFFTYTYTDTIKHSISFRQIIDHDTLTVRQYMFADIDTVILNAGLKIETRTMQWGESMDLDDVYLLKNITDKEYLSSVELAANHFFITDITETDYDTTINQFAKTVQKYPDSHSLISFLCGLKNQYHRRDAVQKIYDNFSDKQKLSYSGIEIRKFLSDKIFYFKNALLPAWDTGTLEPIIKDFSKINLVIFSASWCAPCRTEIPILKKIAKELGDEIAMVYISMDKTTTVDAWKKLMIDQKITWRSVLAANNLEEIEEQFKDGYGLPSVLMVYPEGKYEKIEVRYDADLNKLYKIAGKSIE